MHDVADEIACAEGCAETISANVLKAVTSHPIRVNKSLKYLIDSSNHEFGTPVANPAPREHNENTAAV